MRKGSKHTYYQWVEIVSDDEWYICHDECDNELIFYSLEGAKQSYIIEEVRENYGERAFLMKVEQEIIE